MGRRDSKNSMKMRRKKSQRKLKGRIKKRAVLTRESRKKK